MIQKTKKYAGLLAILPLFLVAIAPNYIGAADAIEGPQAEIHRIILQHDTAYEVSFKVYAGSEDLKAGKLLVTSDISEREVLFSGVSANSFTGTNQIRIVADDPSTISAEYMVEPEVNFPEIGNRISKNSDMESKNTFRQGHDLSDFKAKTNTFRD